MIGEVFSAVQANGELWSRIGGFWVLSMLWLGATGFTYDTATITTLLIAIFGFMFKLNGDIQEIKGSMEIVNNIVLKKAK